MAHLFHPDALASPPFSHRLQLLFDEARRTLCLAAVALVELAASDGRVAPAWRHWSPWPRPPSALPLDMLERLVAGPEVRAASRAELDALGAPFDDCPAATLIALSVAPRLSRHPDALLIVVHESDVAPQSALLAELKQCLEQGLSADRRERLAEVVFQAVEQAGDPIELTDSHARLLYANAAWERTFGYAVEAVVGETVGRLFRDPVAPIHDTAFYQFTLATLADGHSWSGALACRTRDGQRVFCEPMVSPFSAKEQGFTGNFAVRRTLAHRAERDAALAIAHHEFRSVLAATPDGVAVLRDGQIYFTNDAFLSMVRRSEQSVIGLTYVDLVHPDDRAQFLVEHEKSVARVRMMRGDGSPRFAEISTAGAVSFEGKPAMILLSRDLTDQQVAEEQLARAEKMSALGALAAGVAHEINNPLAYVLLNLHYLQQSTTLQGPALDALHEAADGSRRIQQIVRELRSYARADGPGPPEPVNIAKAATSAINIAQNEIRHRARLERNFEGDLHALAREGPLVQMLVNLLVNAAHAIPALDGATHVIRVSSAALSESRAVLEVSDTGVGIAPSALAHVFDPFSTSKRRGEGSGLGLAISKRIVEGFGGQISISSGLGEGTTVRIELPRAPCYSRDREVSAMPRERHSAARPKPRLLIVDDELTVARALKRVLTQYEITVVGDPNEAVGLLRIERSFDVILCDLMMPGVTGPELYQGACSLHPALQSRFVFMTGGAFADWAREFLERTRCPILHKPFSLEDVCEIVERILARAN